MIKKCLIYIMFGFCLSIVLGLLIIYLIFNKEKREALTQRAGVKLAVPQSPKTGTVPTPASLPATLTLGEPSPPNITILNTPICKKCPYQGPPWRRRRYYSEFKEIYSPKARRLPGEDIRFDLLTPIPYSDAFVAPMGHSQSQSATAPTLAQITYPHQKTSYGSRFS